MLMWLQIGASLPLGLSARSRRLTSGGSFTPAGAALSLRWSAAKTTAQALPSIRAAAVQVRGEVLTLTHLL